LRKRTPIDRALGLVPEREEVKEKEKEKEKEVES
jgi:hypothetical protein